MSTRLVKVRLPVARKSYRCIWCGQDIQAGNFYARTWVQHEGAMQDHTWHTECLEYLDVNSDGKRTFEPYENQRPESNDALTWPW